MNQSLERLGKYRILGVAGQGSMGVVYRGHDPFVDREVAIKLCTVAPGEEGEDSRESLRARRMFFNEAQAAGNLDHPNILRVYDAGEHDGEPYIVMEYLEGARTLRDHTDPANLLPVETVIDYMTQAARALGYAHRNGVTHRDIKPANLMLTREGLVKIVDFGIAQRTHAETTQVMGAFGSPRYMSPEQAMDEAITGQTDLYSLGVVTYELLVGQPPFVADQIPGLLYKILHEDPPPMRARRPELPEALEALVVKALEKDPERRFATGEEMAEAFERVLETMTQPAAEMSEEERYALVRALRFFSDFSATELHEVLEQAEWRGYGDGERILGEGEAEESFFVLVQGEVVVSKGEQAIGTIATGESFGEMGYLSGLPRSATVHARGRVLALEFSSRLTEWASFPCQLRFNKAFQRTLIERLARTSEDLAALI